MIPVKVISVNTTCGYHHIRVKWIPNSCATVKKVQNTFNKAAYELHIPISSAEAEMWARNVDLRTYPGGLMRQVEHTQWVEQISSCGYLTWYTALPNRHQRKHRAAWKLANKLDA